MTCFRCVLYAMTRAECVSLATKRDARHNFMSDVRGPKVGVIIILKNYVA